MYMLFELFSTFKLCPQTAGQLCYLYTWKKHTTTVVCDRSKNTHWVSGASLYFLHYKMLGLWALCLSFQYCITSPEYSQTPFPVDLLTKIYIFIIWIQLIHTLKEHLKKQKKHTNTEVTQGIIQHFFFYCKIEHFYCITCMSLRF